jgi:hypothetical protein
MPKYTTRPVVVTQLFDDSTYKEILSFMVNYIPMMPMDIDPTGFNRNYAHNVGFFRNIHVQLADYASDLFGTKVKPSYSFLSLYNKHGQCPLHIDRPQCRYTIDYLIQQEQKDPWPIHIGPSMSDEERDAITNAHPSTKADIKQVVDSVDWTEANLNPNDAVCYSGTNAWHYRPTKSEGKADLVFFHFVPEAFNGSLD